jgi:pimeloyl-ACP methyl ester carboxylesterase
MEPEALRTLCLLAKFLHETDMQLHYCQLPYVFPKSDHSPVIRIAYYTAGNPLAKRTLLCVHGLTRNSRDFDFIVQILSPHFRIYCLDMPGRGHSQWLPDPSLYHYGTYLALIMNFCAHFQLEKIDWLGTSMGGILGMMLAAQGYIPVESMVINDIGAMIPASALARLSTYVGIQPRFVDFASGERYIRQILAPFGIEDDAHWHHVTHHSIIPKEDGWYQHYDPSIAKHFQQSDGQEDVLLWDLWNNVKAERILLLRGSKSDIFDLETAKKMQETGSHIAYHEFANIGHAPSLMRQEEHEIVANWLLQPLS